MQSELFLADISPLSLFKELDTTKSGALSRDILIKDFEKRFSLRKSTVLQTAGASSGKENLGIAAFSIAVRLSILAQENGGKLPGAASSTSSSLTDSPSKDLSYDSSGNFSGNTSYRGSPEQFHKAMANSGALESVALRLKAQISSWSYLEGQNPNHVKATPDSADDLFSERSSSGGDPLLLKISSYSPQVSLRRDGAPGALQPHYPSHQLDGNSTSKHSVYTSRLAREFNAIRPPPNQDPTTTCIDHLPSVQSSTNLFDLDELSCTTVIIQHISPSISSASHCLSSSSSRCLDTRTRSHPDSLSDLISSGDFSHHSSQVCSSLSSPVSAVKHVRARATGALPAGPADLPDDQGQGNAASTQGNAASTQGNAASTQGNAAFLLNSSRNDHEGPGEEDTLTLTSNSMASRDKCEINKCEIGLTGRAVLGESWSAGNESCSIRGQSSSEINPDQDSGEKEIEENKELAVRVGLLVSKCRQANMEMYLQNTNSSSSKSSLPGVPLGYPPCTANSAGAAGSHKMQHLPSSSISCKTPAARSMSLLGGGPNSCLTTKGVLPSTSDHGARAPTMATLSSGHGSRPTNDCALPKDTQDVSLKDTAVINKPRIMEKQSNGVCPAPGSVQVAPASYLKISRASSTNEPTGCGLWFTLDRTQTATSSVMTEAASPQLHLSFISASSQLHLSSETMYATMSQSNPALLDTGSLRSVSTRAPSDIRTPSDVIFIEKDPPAGGSCEAIIVRRRVVSSPGHGHGPKSNPKSKPLWEQNVLEWQQHDPVPAGKVRSSQTCSQPAQQRSAAAAAAVTESGRNRRQPLVPGSEEEKRESEVDRSREDRHRGGQEPAPIWRRKVMAWHQGSSWHHQVTEQDRHRVASKGDRDIEGAHGLEVRRQKKREERQGIKLLEQRHPESTRRTAEDSQSRRDDTYLNNKQIIEDSDFALALQIQDMEKQAHHLRARDVSGGRFNNNEQDSDYALALRLYEEERRRYQSGRRSDGHL